MDYAFKHEGKAYTPNSTKDVKDVEAHNAAIEERELAWWFAAPSEFCVYIAGNHATTWTGVILGDVIRRASFRTNMSRNMVAVTIRGTNGTTYYGRYGADWSQLCRVRKAKGSK